MATEIRIPNIGDVEDVDVFAGKTQGFFGNSSFSLD
jgi:hypothetical protein